MAHFSPPLSEVRERMRPALNEGELAVLMALESLDDSWRVFVQPRIRMSLPDFVVAHPTLGVCVIEVKDWGRGIYRQRSDGVVEVRSEAGWQATRENPRGQVAKYRQVLIEGFYASPSDDKQVWPHLRGLVILPNYSTKDAEELLYPWEGQPPVEVPPGPYLRVVGKDSLTPQSILAAVRDPQPRRQAPREDNFRRLCRHLAEPEVVAQQRRPLELTASSKAIARNSNNTRIRRVRGPAGCGKSVALAARAAELSTTGRNVLVLTFNITLPHYLRDLAARHCMTVRGRIRSIQFIHFHGFCKEVVGLAQDKHNRWQTKRAYGSAYECESHDAIERLVNSAMHVYRALDASPPKFDAILVDEGQDFTGKWWRFLRDWVLNDGGEMLLVADTTQDLYGRAGWTREASMVECGFRGRWMEMSGSYRLPPDLVPIVAEFGRRHIRDGAYDPPAEPDDPQSARGSVEGTLRRWINVENRVDLANVVAEEVIRMMTVGALPSADVVFLAEKHEDGLRIVERVNETAGASVSHLMHVFTEADGEARRRRKQRFWGGTDGLKGCTVHSFKGWEARGVVVTILPSERSHRLAYVALTRVKGVPGDFPSRVTVVNLDRQLDEFQVVFEREFTAAEMPRLPLQRRLL